MVEKATTTTTTTTKKGVGQGVCNIPLDVDIAGRALEEDEATRADQGYSADKDDDTRENRGDRIGIHDPCVDARPNRWESW